MGLWDLWGKYRETREANEEGFRTDEAENAGVAVAARLCSLKDSALKPLSPQFVVWRWVLYSVLKRA